MRILKFLLRFDIDERTIDRQDKFNYLFYNSDELRYCDALEQRFREDNKAT